MEPSDADAFVEDIEGLKVQDLFLLFKVIEPEGRLDEDSLPRVGQVDYLVEQVPQERVALLIFEPRHGYVLVVVQLFVANLLENVEIPLHVGVAVYQLLKLLVEHLQPVHMDEILDVLQTYFETG